MLFLYFYYLIFLPACNSKGIKHNILLSTFLVDKQTIWTRIEAPISLEMNIQGLKNENT